MDTLYAVSTFICSECLPKTNTLEDWISILSDVLNGFHTSLLIVRRYMMFIDELFQNSFLKLGYQIETYKYPGYLEEGCSIVRWINERYGVKLHEKQEIIYTSETIPYSGKQIEIFLTKAFMDTERLERAGCRMNINTIKRIFGYVNRTDQTNGIFQMLDIGEKYAKTLEFDKRVNKKLYWLYLAYMFVIRYSRFGGVF